MGCVYLRPLHTTLSCLTRSAGDIPGAGVKADVGKMFTMLVSLQEDFIFAFISTKGLMDGIDLGGYSIYIYMFFFIYHIPPINIGSTPIR